MQGPTVPTCRGRHPCSFWATPCPACPWPLSTIHSRSLRNRVRLPGRREAPSSRRAPPFHVYPIRPLVHRALRARARPSFSRRMSWTISRLGRTPQVHGWRIPAEDRFLRGGTDEAHEAPGPVEQPKVIVGPRIPEGLATGRPPLRQRIEYTKIMRSHHQFALKRLREYLHGQHSPVTRLEPIGIGRAGDSPP